MPLMLLATAKHKAHLEWVSDSPKPRQIYHNLVLQTLGKALIPALSPFEILYADLPGLRANNNLPDTIFNKPLNTEHQTSQALC